MLTGEPAKGSGIPMCEERVRDDLGEMPWKVIGGRFFGQCDFMRQDRNDCDVLGE
jgi:hypothetical protein